MNRFDPTPRVLDRRAAPPACGRRLGPPAWMLPDRLLPLPDPEGQVVVVLVTLLVGGTLLAFVHRALADE